MSKAAKEYRIKTHKQLTSTIRTYPIMEQLIDEFATDFSNQQNKDSIKDFVTFVYNNDYKGLNDFLLMKAKEDYLNQKQ